ncbi:hypothetical protein HB777_23950 [Mesorhizobium loti]|nr:hypothetical protein HB777_23950 [Mesorhizobium loti]
MRLDPLRLSKADRQRAFGDLGNITPPEWVPYETSDECYPANDQVVKFVLR